MSAPTSARRHPTIATVIPTYNQVALLQKTCASLFAQQSPPEQVIIVDDGSVDGTAEYLATIADRVTTVRTENRGRNAARNLGLGMCTTDYVHFLDHDDLLYENTYEIVRELAVEHDLPSMIHLSAQGFSDDLPPRADDVDRDVRSYPCFLDARDYTVWLGCSGMLFRHDRITAVGGFFPHRFTMEDVDLVLRMSCEPGFLWVNRPRLYGYRTYHAGSGTLVYDHNISGVNYLLDHEEAGDYPGGAVRAADRYRFFGRPIRNMALDCGRLGDVGNSIRLYWRSFWYNAREGRWRFLAAAPFYTFFGRAIYWLETRWKRASE